MMKILFITLFSFLAIPIVWLGDFKDAVKEAQTSHKTILINFSGSDWCGPCIRMRKEILESDAFVKYAADHLILVSCDLASGVRDVRNLIQEGWHVRSITPYDMFAQTAHVELLTYLTRKPE